MGQMHLWQRTAAGTLLPAILLLQNFRGLSAAASDGDSITKGPEWNGAVLQLNNHPRLFHLKNFLTHEECDWLVAKARPHLENTTVISSTTGLPIPSKERTSAGMFYETSQDAVIRAVEDRVASVTHIPKSHQERMQALNYHDGQKYSPHHDFFHAGKPKGNGSQRVATVLMYLSTPEEGGETVFPKAQPKVTGGAWSPCAKQGFAVKATKGDAVLFWALKPDQERDLSSLHGSCPTLKGQKWSATVWCAVAIPCICPLSVSVAALTHVCLCCGTSQFVSAFLLFFSLWNIVQGVESALCRIQVNPF
mmetsp:Transcript_17819/g.53699  ORF Transcript_17819/g.53699 Transcript_17819/m.53699 type:complete len:307 (+) Transcript_17819:464-1384(+)